MIRNPQQELQKLIAIQDLIKESQPALLRLIERPSPFTNLEQAKETCWQVLRVKWESESRFNSVLTETEVRKIHDDFITNIETRLTNQVQLPPNN